jgi:hypothetical protein
LGAKCPPSLGDFLRAFEPSNRVFPVVHRTTVWPVVPSRHRFAQGSSSHGNQPNIPGNSQPSAADLAPSNSLCRSAPARDARPSRRSRPRHRSTYRGCRMHRTPGWRGTGRGPSASARGDIGDPDLGEDSSNPSNASAVSAKVCILLRPGGRLDDLSAFGRKLGNLGECHRHRIGDIALMTGNLRRAFLR